MLGALPTVFLCPDGRLQYKDNYIFTLMESSARRFRFSKRNPARNVSMSLIGGTTKGDSNSFDGGETGITGEEREAALGAAFGEWLPPFSRK
jgi:hypothetical protein